MERRKRRSFNAEALRLVREGGKSLPQVANDIDLTESALRNQVNEADGGKDKSPAGARIGAEREALMGALAGLAPRSPWLPTSSSATSPPASPMAPGTSVGAGALMTPA